MVQRAQGFAFPRKTLDVSRVVAQSLGLEHFEGDSLPGMAIPPAIHRAHSTLPEDRPPGTPFAAPVPVADDLSALDRLAAFLGRTP